MKIVEEVKQLDAKIPRGIALGNFDGLHIGHQALIRLLVNKSNEYQLESCVYTFKNHTISLISSGDTPPQITNQMMKIQLMEELELETLVLAEFNQDIMGLSPEDFVKNILVNGLNCKVAVVGFDYRFGSKAKGDATILKELGKKYGFEVYVIDPVTVDRQKVSSTGVRTFVDEGDMEKAREFLGRFFAIKNQVVHGKGRGKKLGYPTANIYVDPQQLIPREGVYATLVKFAGRTHMGATCIGTTPTFDGKETTIETFILDYDGELYDEDMEIQFVTRLRSNVKFNGIEALVQQITKDVEISKKHLQPYLDMLK
ncbi:bifunctional riboflavin kinase/FAD synthetase [Alkaliphilus hydrothermalis]|uniref:Riboflavin biosynthesis protein n=1 Tax=Alkaliphilus hydrothermalis TaxID=1482730 RepID=A0ABS2NLA4_9FIRM|nr:bifunctional riboflavin kinase/FAD synthetase [Alkaliphilus hydrothermalis]MBM7613711.1 riboflavin kinase/FMN adenylyltransferase [Alkaliphilus hydrothermalis]